MDKNTSQKSALGAMFSVAAVWFGTHVGGGFATGNQTVQYFVKYRFTALFMPALVIILLGWCYYNGAVMAKNHKAFRYDELAHHLYAPFSSAGKLFFDIAFFVLVVSRCRYCNCRWRKVVCKPLGIELLHRLYNNRSDILCSDYIWSRTC
ncbi:hypothetical protein HMPREF9099_01196 [Lachnospiraceae bacterium oral taxon 082 str. F0431]|nr:hypothetical protein HMPREF9099_01196 [Lachnospiraceae bacterium oral taxon 082 str. F0431]